MFNFKHRVLTNAVLISLASISLAACHDAKNGNSTLNKPQAFTTIVDEETIFKKANSIVEKLSDDGFVVERTFPGPEGSGLTGLVVKSKNGGGGKQIGWTTTGGNFVLPGPLFNSDGEDLSEKYMQEYGGLLKPTALADAVDKEDLGFVAGTKGPIVTMFFEPYCGYCNRMFADLEPKIDAGELRVRFVMVPFLAEDSAERAAAILEAKDPYKALKEWEHTKDKSAVKKVAVSDATKAQVERGGQLFSEAQLGGTPASLICDKTGKVDVVRGYQQDTAAFVANLSENGHDICN